MRANRPARLHKKVATNTSRNPRRRKAVASDIEAPRRRRV
jgi:hypothetical protein